MDHFVQHVVIIQEINHWDFQKCQRKNAKMLEKIPEKDLDSYTIFLARYLALFVGMPMMFGVVLKPLLILLLIVGLDQIWFKLKELNLE